MTFVDWSSSGYAGPRASAELARIAATGANRVMVVVTAYQPHAGSPIVESGDPRTPSFAAVDEALTGIRGLGLGAALKPHVDLDDGEWRGTIDPPDPRVWFDSYMAFLLPWVDLARQAGVELFVVGTELAETQEHEDLWRETTAAVRRRFSGEVVYAASWDEAPRVRFWDALDYLGVDFYYPVTRRRGPSRVEILAGWQPWLDGLARLAARTGRDILLTEIGYRSVDGAGMYPYDFTREGRLDLAEQADLYWAAMEAARQSPWMAGLFWWNWPATGGGGPEDDDFTPRGKPAEEELARAWGNP